MMTRIIDLAERILKTVGAVRPYSDDDVINASTEDAARTHNSVLRSLHTSIQKRVQGNEALRRSITIAKIRTSSLSDFERRMKRRGMK